MKIKVATTIDAPPAATWRTVESIERHVDWMADADSIRFTSAKRRGVSCDVSSLWAPFLPGHTLSTEAWQSEPRVTQRRQDCPIPPRGRSSSCAHSHSWAAPDMAMRMPEAASHKTFRIRFTSLEVRSYGTSCKLSSRRRTAALGTRSPEQGTGNLEALMKGATNSCWWRLPATGASRRATDLDTESFCSYAQRVVTWKRGEEHLPAGGNQT